MTERVWALRWGQASDWLFTTGGLRLEQLGLPATARDWPVFSLRLKPRPEGELSFLQVEGAGPVHSIALQRVGEGWRFRQADSLGLLAGELRLTGETLDLALDSGRLDTNMGALSSEFWR